jgi:crotonobetainyl-CoA:carnitine CoA-transferase CaiB-like acyl-CoA transferase
MIPLLQGITVLEITSVVMGPFAGQVLADLGAQVIKIEPLAGDMSRDAHPRSPEDGLSAMYLNNNRNKKIIALDLKDEAGRAIAERLMARCDVFLHNLRMDAIERLGLGYEAAVAINPRIIYCSAIGYGQNGRYKDRPAFDDVIQAACGLTGLSQRLGSDPQFVPTIIADKVGALYTVYGIMAALIGRLRGNNAAIKVEMPMFEALTSFMLNEHLAGATFAHSNIPAGYSRLLSPNRRPHKTKDGWIVVLPYTGDQWTRFLKETGRQDILNEPWFKNAAERAGRIDYLYGEMSRALAMRNTDDWVATLSALDIPFSRVNTIEDLLADPHLNDVGFFKLNGAHPAEVGRSIPQPVTFEGVAAQPDRAAPALGSDSREILGMCGYNPSEIDDLITHDIVRENL